MWYYGVRYGRGCSPEDLWVTYFTSSMYVEQARHTLGEPDVVQVRKTFNSAKQARHWEDKVLTRMHVVRDVKFLNKSDNAKNFCNQGGYKLPPRTQDHCKKISRARKGKSYMTLSERKKRSSMYAGKGNPNYNKIATEATRHKMKLAQQGRPIVASGRHFKYGVDAARFYNTTAQVVSYRLKSQSAKWADWYYEDVGPVTPKPAPKRPDVALRNQSEVSRERSRKNALARWSKA